MPMMPISAPAAATTTTASSAAVQERRGSASHERAAPPHLRFTRVRLSTGVELQLTQAGRPDGEPVLFLHGFTDSWFSYSLVLERLPAGIRALIPTQRGHGDSERPECCYRIADFAADAVALLDALGMERATVVGHSLGSFVAQRIAIDRPERVHRLVLIGSGTTPRTAPGLEFNEVVQTLTDPIAPEFVREFQQSTAFAPLPAAFLAGVVAESGKLPARVWREALTGLLAAEAREELGRIQATTLVVWGEEDGYWPRPEQDGLIRAIRGARLVTYPETGHAPHWERPARFVADLQAFLADDAVGLRVSGAQWGTNWPGGTR